ncbi:MAG: carbamoyltransferase HypF [Bacillota bacterium]|nr:carbamoyltransferase HypF [Bacillota bacterium]
MAESKMSVEITIKGIVQGVGFRPFALKLARCLSINGFVGNKDSSVFIVAEGEEHKINEFIERLSKDAPKISVIKDFIVNKCSSRCFENFDIIPSITDNEESSYISPDLSICKDCKDEFFQKDNKRYLYPFINCTNCGPRFTIVEGVPYDRIRTTMNKFKMCSQCQNEYENPEDRRYHAQPVACPDCGPALRIVENNGNVIEDDNILKYCAKKIMEGKILAVKGLGGYHLACDGMNEESIIKLRKRKIRDEKPFAVMVKDIKTVMKYCVISDSERKLLESVAAPIVLLRKKEGAGIIDAIAPGNPYLGVMLPYTPVHLGLFCHMQTDMLVMTSGNRSSEPIYYKDEEAFSNLKEIADLFLMNNREIFIRTDDSVTRIINEKEMILRRSRGYVPSPISMKLTGCHMPRVLACGGELKNTFCITKGDEVYISHHIGDLVNSETYDSFENGIIHFEKILKTDFDIVAYDLHPQYLSTKYALSLQKKLFPVQHHHAHIASCMAENQLTGEVIGVAFDGTGFGEDGKIWGGEFFTGGYTGFKREAHLEYVKMPGGDMAVKEPWRMALSYYCNSIEDIYGRIDCGEGSDTENKLFKDIETNKINTVKLMLERNINCPLTSSMGRLFDAVSAIIGIRYKVSYEGQAAIELEHLADKSSIKPYRFSLEPIDGKYIIRTKEIISGIIDDFLEGQDKARISAKFHETIAFLVLTCCVKIREKSGLNRVVLSGGVFQNITLLTRCMALLNDNSFEVFTHSKVPANDGGLSLGQAAMAIMSNR